MTKMKWPTKKHWQHGTWLTAGGQATIEHSEIVACIFNMISFLVANNDYLYV